MIRESHVRFLGEGREATLDPYPLTALWASRPPTWTPTISLVKLSSISQREFNKATHNHGILSIPSTEPAL